MAQPDQQRAEALSSPHMLERVMDCLRERFVVIDRNYKILVVNDAALPNGVSKEQILYQQLFDVYPNLLVQGFKQLVDNVFATSESHVELFVRHTTIDGFTGYHHRKFIPLKDVFGRVEAVIAILENVHDERLAQLQTKQVEHEFEQMIETLQLVSFELNASGTIVKINKAVMPLFGYDSADLLGKSFTRSIHPDDVRSTWHVYWQIVNLGKPFGVCENRFAAADGSYLHMRWSIHPLYDAGGTVVGCRGVGENITADAERMRDAAERAHMFEQTIQAAPLPLLIVANGTIEKINRAAERLLQVHLRDGAVKLQQLCSEKQLDVLLKLYEQAQGRGSAHAKLVLSVKETELPVMATAIRIRNAVVIALKQ
ncbi:MAG: hypothetical protein A2848_01665 [Candidatus Magasanikbacteria bacterium RIFCSPHIGHO2_01_FULL_50_8]|uniref:histidine kinase n=2 Tax=Candidatus Magasanikiibacteriota TaxID=1752731 RepID=A0A1F6LQW1_9BACT|nr:MAG: hypothetical protein A2848_01665 [Candidatus Magasanikbacteria bacterium RIFCSPHIGHO2_01_FULL_50_8]OGH67607.1 MAG: hypothetical protein A3C15_01490 [Candidatus Magasanikbacteria bacterium RIFCSPHIGHO2_02_FULL_50_9b]